jgi:hypothetical protein
MPIGSTNVYNAGDLILSTVSGSGTSFTETKITAATSSLILFNSSGNLTSQSLNSITVGTSSYVSGSTSIITNLTASNISASNKIQSNQLTASSILANNGPLMVTGSNAYIQMFPVGGFSLPTNLSASYIYTSGSTNDMYFSQYNGPYTNTTRLRWLEGTLYTGLMHGGVITSTPGSTTFNISAGEGIIVSMNASTASAPFPTVKQVSWPTYTNQPIQYSGSAKITYVGIDNVGGIVQQTNSWGSSDINQWDTQIFLGVVLHLSGSVSSGVFNSPQISYANPQQADDFFRSFGPLKISGHTLQASGSSPTLSIKKSGGTAYREGANYLINPNHPSTVVENAITSSKIYRYYLSGSTPIIDTGIANVGYTTIDNDNYVNTATGQLTSVGNSNWTIQRVFWIPNSPTNAFLVYYGNATYATLLDAVNAKDSEPFTEAPNTALNAIFLGYIIVEGGAGRDLLNATESTIIQGGLFRNVGGIGSGGTNPVSTTLAGLSDVSLSGLAEGDLLAYGGGQWNNKKQLVGNYGITGSLNVQSGITANLTGTSSWATNALTASYLTPTNNYIIAGLTNNGSLSQQGTLSMGSGYQILATTGTELSPGIAFVGDTNTGIYSPGGDTIGFSTNGSEKVRINNSGSVGVGTNNPLYKLHIVGNVYGTTTGQFGNAVITGTGTGFAVYGSNAGATGVKINLDSDISRNDLVISASSGYVGIGTSSPSAKLTIVDNTNGGTIHLVGRTSDDTAAINFRATGDGSTYAYIAPDTNEFRMYHNDGFMSFYPGGTEKVRITSGGLVGIGTTSVNNKLDIWGSTGTTFNMANTDDSGRGGKLTFISSSAAGRQFYVGTNSAIYNLTFGIDSVEKARIDLNGNLGIGTNNPTQKLEVQGSAQIGNDSVTTVGLKLTRIIGGIRTSEHTFHSANNSPWYTYGQNLTWTGELAGTVESTHAYRPYFEGFVPVLGYKIFGFMNVTAGSFTNANIVNALTLKNDGNVGIGTTSPAFLLDVSGSSRLGFTSTNTHQFTGSVNLNGSLSTNSNITASNLNVSSTVTCLSLTETSTQAVKYNILPLSSQLDNVMKLKPVSFNYKTNDKHSIGLIAEEVAKIYPEFTSENNDSISYGKITSVLIQSIKELKNIIDNQQKQIEDLSNKLKQF